jgi:hypothetical protein
LKTENKSKQSKHVINVTNVGQTVLLFDGRPRIFFNPELLYPGQEIARHIVAVLAGHLARRY